jgi:S-formylglutathione hydrolase FrmB
MLQNIFLKLFLKTFLILLSFSLFAQGTIKLSEKMPSQVLNKKMDYSIYLPNSYSEENTYAALYLLHGFGGDETNWVVKAEIKHIADSLIAIKKLPEIIIVMPAGENSYYINDYKNKCPYEDFFLNEFIPFIDSNYQTRPQKIFRLIGGLSMGGFGATILPVKHPDVFGTSVNISGAVRNSEQLISMPNAVYSKFYSQVYGDSLSGSERITDHWKANSPYYIIDTTLAQQLKTINWYIDCGLQDPLFATNTALHNLYIEYEIEHEFHTRPGAHTWNYWRKSIIYALIYCGEILNK